MMLPAFNWIVDRRLAGSGRPGLLAELDEDHEFLTRQGIATIVTLTEKPVPGLAEHGGFECVHFPIPDMGFPMPRDCARLCREVVERVEESPVLLHCRAGLGRTGTIAACCLVAMGSTASSALLRIRSINRYYVQTTSQERFIHHFADYLAREQAEGDGAR